MKLLTYLTQSNKNFRYVGTIWGDQPVGLIPGKDLAKALRRLGYGRGDIASYYDEDGFYITPRSVTYRNGGAISETVLEIMD